MDYAVLGILCLFLAVVDATSKLCPATIPGSKATSYQRMGDTCYYFSGHSEVLTVMDAQATCQRGGGNMVSILSVEENSFVWNHVANTYRMGDGRVWLGLIYDEAFDFSWLDGSRFDYDNIGPRHVYLKDRTVCGVMDVASGYWKVRECLFVYVAPFYGYTRLPFVCKFEGRK